jgi:hypothetical protein
MFGRLCPFFMRLRVGFDAAGGPSLPAAVPAFVWQLIEDKRSPESMRCLSFVDIVNFLKKNRFQITAGVDSDEVSAFVSSVEWHFENPCFDARSIPWHFADPIFSHLDGLGINAACRVSFWSEL